MAAVLGAAALAAVGAGPASGQQRLVDPIPETIPPSDVGVGLRTVADGLVNPITGVAPRRDRNHLYVLEQRGVLWQVDIARHARREGDGRGDKRRSKRIFADLRSLLVPLGCFDINYDERGALGLAFDPNYRRNGLLYTYTSEPHAGGPATPCASATPDHDNVVREWRVPRPRSSRAVVDPSSGREVLRDTHPQFNHNAGALNFGPDGMLYIADGDGGGADDQGPGHVEGGNAQSLGTILGKILRIDPHRGPNGEPYTVPDDNPFVNVDGARPEIWAYGFRNPFRTSFDRRTGDFYVADVGQNSIEEVNVVQRGGNYGWRLKEGSFAFVPGTETEDGFVTDAVVPGLLNDPIAEYDHCRGPVNPDGSCTPEGIAVVGGYVYRGREFEALRGHYVFGDFGQNFFASTGRLFQLGDDDEVLELLHNGEQLNRSLLGIGEDARGELYVMSKTGGAPGNVGVTDENNSSGTVQLIVPEDEE